MNMMKRMTAGLLILMGFVESWKEKRLLKQKGDARHGQA